jgi:hypothetical protein
MWVSTPHRSLVSMALSTPITPFAKPVPPPRPIVVLLYATDLFINDIGPVLAHEDLRPGRRPVGRPSTRYHPYNPRDVNPLPHPSQSSADNTTPCPPSHVTICQQPPNVPSPSLLDSTPLNSPVRSLDEGEGFSRAAYTSDLAPEAVSAKLKIPRPNGAGRKNLLEQVNWERGFYDAVKVGSDPLLTLHS